MMEQILKIKRNIFIKNSIDIPEKYIYEIEDVILKLNIRRQVLLSGALIATCFVLLFLHNIKLEYNGIKTSLFEAFSYLHIFLILVSSIFLLLVYFIKRANKENLLLIYLLHMLISSCVLILCTLIAINNYAFDKQPLAFIIAVFCIASLILLTPLERIVVYIVPYILYIMGAYFAQDNNHHLFQDILFATILIAMAFAVSHTNYSSYVRNFINNRIILEKSKEIENMYGISEMLLKKRTEELNETIEYEKLRTAFFANISHELRTPLNVIFSAEQMVDFLIKDSNPQDRQKEIRTYMAMIKQNCYRLIRLIANLIDITKIDAGHFQVNLTNNDIVKIVEDITLSVSKYIESKNIGITFDTEIEEIVIACDPDKIERIILNLLSNAIKFTDAGGHIYVNIYERDKSVIISVRDTGIGIPDFMKELIFEKFIQVDKTISRNREGSGIGLSLVKALVDMHEGSIELKSQQGKGSEFIIELPKKVECNLEKAENQNLINENQSVEKINIEFSDIYS